MTVEGEMRSVLARMQLIQYGKTQNFNASGGKSENPDPRPSGEANPMADEWRQRFNREPTHETVEAARGALEAWAKRQTPVETDDSTLEDWVVDDGEGYAVAQVAGKFGIAEARVRRIRLKADRESEFGLPARFAHHVGPKLSDLDRIKSLADRGCTERQIAFQVGVGKSTVRRALGKAA